jgi:hypothetical protein
MSVVSGDFETRLSGGASNAVGNASIGGTKSSELAPTTLNGLFDAVDASEALAGDTEYRCVYVHNANVTDTMTNLVAYISSDTPSADSAIAIGVGAATVNATETAIANESTAPASVTFSAPGDAGSGISLGTIPPGQHRALWIRRTISATAGNTASDPATIGYRCETE